MEKIKIIMKDGKEYNIPVRVDLLKTVDLNSIPFIACNFEDSKTIITAYYVVLFKLKIYADDFANRLQEILEEDDGKLFGSGSSMSSYLNEYEEFIEGFSKD